MHKLSASFSILSCFIAVVSCTSNVPDTTLRYDEAECMFPDHYQPGTYMFITSKTFYKEHRTHVYDCGNYLYLPAYGRETQEFGQHTNLTLFENISRLMEGDTVPYKLDDYGLPSDTAPMRYAFLPGRVKDLKIFPASDLQNDITDEFLIVGNIEWYCWAEEGENTPLPVYSCETKSAFPVKPGISIQEYLSYSPMATEYLLFKLREGNLKESPYGDLVIFYTVEDYTYTGYYSKDYNHYL